VALIYGANYSIAKIVLDGEYVDALGFVFFRVFTALILFRIVYHVFIREKVDKKDFPMFFLCGLTGVAINQLLFISGLEFTTPIHAALIMTIIPIPVLITSAIILHEKITRRKVLGIVLGAIGAILLISYNQTVSFKSEQLLGDLMVLVNATSYGIYLVLVKKLLVKYHPLTVITWVFSFGFLVVAPIGWTEAMNVEWSIFTTEIWLSFFYVLIFTTFFAYLLNSLGLQVVSPTVVAIYVYLQPLLATVIALLLNKDVISVHKVISCIFIFLGVYFVSDLGKPVT
jgi:drug/metabolite transporter (DMT)-like permease